MELKFEHAIQMRKVTCIYIIRRIVRIDFRIRLGTWYWLLDEYLIDEMRIDIGRVIFQEHITAVRLLFMKLEMRNAVRFCDTVKTDGLKAVRISCINAKFPIFRIDVQIQSDIRIVLMGDHQFGTLRWWCFNGIVEHIAAGGDRFIRRCKYQCFLCAVFDIILHIFRDIEIFVSFADRKTVRGNSGQTRRLVVPCHTSYITEMIRRRHMDARTFIVINVFFV